MGELLGKALAAARKQRGITQQEIAAQFKISRPAVGQWESGTAEPSSDKLGRLGQILGIDIFAAMQGQVVTVPAENRADISQPVTLVRRSDVRPPAPDDPAGAIPRMGGPRNVPVYGTVAGGKDGDFSLNRETIDYAPRQPGIAQRRDVYALYVVNDSMAPKYEEGELLYVDPHRAPSINDYVIIELHPEEDGEPGQGFIKRLKRRTPTLIVVEQFNPAGEIEFDRDRVKSLHRVIPVSELLGL